MSVSLTINRPGQVTEFVDLFGQRTATEWVGELAEKHNFRLFDGGYPVFLYEPGDLETAISELSMMRDEDVARIESDERFTDSDKQHVIRKWARVLDALEQLKTEPDTKAYFG